ncbi:hypothetical protein BH23ACT11_BH23ACT11_18060 [soil metagenome]
MSLMSLTQPRRDNPLMNGYFREVGLPGKRLAKRCGVSHSQIYMARKRNVGPDNAERISRGVANILGLAEENRLRLKAEIMGHPGNLLRAWLGNVADVARLLDIPEPTAREILDPGKAITHKSGSRALERLRELGAPGFLTNSVDRRLLPPPEPRRGNITHELHGPELSARLRSTRRSLAEAKPLTHEAIQVSKLTKKEIHERAGVGKETMRQALYNRCGRRSAGAISGVLADAAGLSDEERESVRQELLEPPQENY